MKSLFILLLITIVYAGLDDVIFLFIQLKPTHRATFSIDIGGQDAGDINI